MERMEQERYDREAAREEEAREEQAGEAAAAATVDASAKLQEETNKEVADLEAMFQKNAQKAVDVLLSKCCEVSLEVPTARVRATRKIAGLAN